MPADDNSLVIIIGAGASKEANLPIGAELKHQIAKTLDIRFKDGTRQISGDDSITQALQHICKTETGHKDNINSYLSICRMIADAMPQAASIDNFIDAHRGDPRIAICGKLAIARCILKAESDSSMKVNSQNIYNKIDFEVLDSTWYNLFFRLIVDGCQLQDVPARLARISIITFNYDRCIENYLHASLRNYYGIGIQQATELLASLKIYHPYGWLGPLPWTTKSNAMDFGATANPHQLIAIANELKTFTEGTDETHSDIVAIRATIRTAARVAFLGFAFNRQNLDLLYGNRKDSIVALNSPVFATALGLSESDAQVIKGELHDISGHQPPSISISAETLPALS